MRDDRLEGVELQLPALDGHRHRHVGADDGEGHLVDDLGDDRVHLAGHDARAGLARRQVDLAEARPAGRTESRRRSLQIFESLIALRLSDDENDMNAPVSLVDSTRSAAVSRSRPRDLAQVPQRRRPRSRGAAVMPVPIAVAPMLISNEQVGVLGEPVVVLAEGRGEAVELLAEGHRHGVLQLRAADLEDVVELDGLVEERAVRSRSSSSSRLREGRGASPTLIAVG